MGLRVAMITPWGKNIRCGIRTYSEALIQGLVEHDVEVYVVRLPRFGSKTPEILRLVVENIPRDRVDLVHVQHEYGLYQGLEGGFYIPHGCQPMETMPSAEAKRSLGLQPEWNIVGYLGFITEYKGIETIIEALEKLPDVALLMAGGYHVGDETGYIANLKRMSFEKLPGRCQWIGYVPEEDLPRIYGAMDIVVYPSLMMTESGALLTALSYGKALIASDLPPVKEKAKLGALTTFKSRNANSLRLKIRKILEDDKLRKKLEEGAKKYASEHSWLKIAEKHVNLYNSVLG